MEKMLLVTRLLSMAATCALVLAVGSEAHGQSMGGRPRLEQSGLSTTIEDGVAVASPINSIAVGDVARAEAEATYWNSRFGPFGLDAIIWTPDADRVGRWTMVEYRRPTTAAEALRFAAGPDTFKTQQRGVADSLPHPLNRLTNQRLSCIDYIVRYKAGGMRIGLTVGTNARDATALLESLETIVADSPNDQGPTAGP